jgi:hypothetical protein
MALEVMERDTSTPQCRVRIVRRHSANCRDSKTKERLTKTSDCPEQKTNALDQAAPLEGWQLPGEFLELRRQMEGRLGKRGRREYVQVLRLLETCSLVEATGAVRQALRFRAIAFDAVKHLLLCAIEQRPPRLI